VRLLLVDECQDSDPLQVELIQALCGRQAQEGKLFFVGDYKQSIYRFRGADPGVFRRLEQETSPAGRLRLTKNFRSQPAILDFVNALFCDALSNRADDLCVVEGDAILQYQPLIPQREQITPTPAVEFLWAIVEDMNKSDAGAREFARRREAEFIARRIRGMLQQKEKIAAENITAEKRSEGKWTTLPVQQKDIAILFRTLSNVQFYEEALRKYGIDYYLVGGHAFYAQQEIHDVVNLLRTLASPADAISLAGVLRSPMFALTDETLFWLAQHPQGLAAGLFADRLPVELTEVDRRRAQFATATLRHLRDRKDRVSITALLNEAFALTGYDAALLAEFMGERKLANLRKLLEQARAFDESGVFGLADFIVQLSEFVAQLPREPLAATHPEGTDVVRLMTIHQSKGLEFPVVFVPDLNRPGRGNDQDAVWHSQLGPLVKSPSQGDKAATISGLDLYKQLNEAEDQAERIRLLYVATTRAADYLVLSSGMFEKDIETPSAPWTKLLAERFNLKTGQFIASLPKSEAYHPPAVKVTTEAPLTDAPIGTSHTWHNLDEAINRAVELATHETRIPTEWRDNADRFDRLANPVVVDLAAQRRFSVTQLNGHLQSFDDFSTPVFLFADEDQNSDRIIAAAGADLGILVHQALARIDFSGLAQLAGTDRREKVRAIVQHGVESSDSHTADLAESATELIERFLQSDRAHELAKAKTIHRELEFMLAWPPKQSTQVVAIGPGRYLQGFIDCLYQDCAGRWHLLDYKTNQISAAAAGSLASQFELQLGVYALAVEQILRKPPLELTVHFLRPAVEHQFFWNDSLRSDIIKRVNQAIETTILQKVF
jgi:ATP-dependent helicase/nuclease subunit A